MTREELRKYEPLWDKWYVQEHLGGGSFGDVYRITCQVYEHTYEAALKVISIPKNLAELREVEMSCESRAETFTYYDQLRQNITSEIDLMEQLKGRTNIVSYEDHDIIPHNQGKDPGYDIFIRMELLEDFGGAIGQESRQWKDNSTIRKLGLDIARGLQICHSHNIIHRDIKLSNIFRSADGDFKIGDFGIARNMSDNQLTMSVKGTFNFMAPEVYNRGHYDYRVDIYSLGMVLYHLMNKNRGPFLPLNQVPTADEKEQALIRRIQGEALPAPVLAGPKMAEVVLKACAFRMEDRYGSMEEFYQALLQLDFADMERPEPELPDGDAANCPEEDWDRTIAFVQDEVFSPVPEIQQTSERKRIPLPAILAVAAVLAIVLSVLVFKPGEKDSSVAKENANLAGTDTEAYENSEDVLATPVCTGEITVSGDPSNEDGLIFENDSFDTIRIQGSFQASETDTTPVDGELVLEHTGDVIEQSGNFSWLFTPTDSEHYLPAEGEIFVTAVHREYVDFDELEKRVKNAKDYRELAAIYQLDLSGVHFKNDDMSVLESMPNLAVLVLSDNELTDISVLAKLPRLQQVYLDGNSDLEDVSPLYGLKHLTVVDLSETKVSEEAKKKIEGILVTDQ